MVTDLSFYYCESHYLNNIFIETVYDEPKQPLQNPCQPSPCGLNSRCSVINEQASCVCLPEYLGSPPNCKPECTTNSDCPINRACFNRKCQDPCVGSCGFEALCHVSNHAPICYCPESYTGNPFTNCYRVEESKRLLID